MNPSGGIAITGLGHPLADGLAHRLLGSDRPVPVVALGSRLPVGLRGKLELHAVDPADPGAESEIGDFLARRSIETVAHMPFEPSPNEGFDGDVGWLARAAANVGSASARAGVKRLIVASSTMCYGARPENPNFLGEDRDLVGHAESPWLLDQCAAEEAVARLALQYPQIDVCTLRHPWVMGPEFEDSVSRYFAGTAVPVPMGRDPLLQFIHERDLLDRFERAVRGEARGIFNVVADGALPVSRLLALAGKKGLAMPDRLLRSVPGAPRLGPGSESAAVFFDYLRYLWVADGERARAEFGTPLYTTQEAWVDVVSARRAVRGGRA